MREGGVSSQPQRLARKIRYLCLRRRFVFCTFIVFLVIDFLRNLNLVEAFSPRTHTSPAQRKQIFSSTFSKM